MEDTYSTSYPATQPNATAADVIHHLNRYETVFLTIFEVLCTVLTLTLNLYLSFLVVCKVKFVGQPPSIPILTASLLGVFHGLSINLIMTISLIRGHWVGPMEWCGAAANIHKYIVYTIIYCQIVITLEVSYMMSNPLSYLRDSTHAMAVMMSATSIALVMDLPMTVAQFFFLFPSGIAAEWGPEVLEQRFFYDKILQVCYRWFFPGTLDYKIIVYFTHAQNFVATVLIIVAFIFIALAVRRSRALKCDSDNVRSPSILKKRKLRERQRRRQNFKIARMAVFSTLFVVLPFSPSLAISCIIDIIGMDAYFALFGRIPGNRLLRFNQFLYYVVPWLFPLSALVTNPAVTRANHNLFYRTLVKTFLPASRQQPTQNLQPRSQAEL